MLLSKIPGNRIVGFRRSKKGKRSTQSRLRVDPGFASFDKLLEVGFLPTWVLFLLLSVLQMFRLFEAVRGCLIGPKTWDRIYKIFGRNDGAAVAALRLIWCEKWVFWC